MQGAMCSLMYSMAARMRCSCSSSVVVSGRCGIYTAGAPVSDAVRRAARMRAAISQTVPTLRVRENACRVIAARRMPRNVTSGNVGALCHACRSTTPRGFSVRGGRKVFRSRCFHGSMRFFQASPQRT